MSDSGGSDTRADPGPCDALAWAEARAAAALAPADARAVPLHLVGPDSLDALPAPMRAWAEASGFDG